MGIYELASAIEYAEGEKSPARSDGLSLLEQLAATAEESCRNPASPLLFGYDTTNNKALLIKASCKKWSCPVCGARNTRKWIARAINGTRVLGGKWYFMTLTPHPHAKKNGWSLKNLQKGIPKLLKRMKRAFGKFEYLRTYEPFKDGEWHSHFIINVQMDWTLVVDTRTGKETGECQWLEDNAAECGMGWKTDYQEIKSPAGTAFYVAKYCTKSLLFSDTWPKGLRRIQTSQSWPKLPELKDETAIDWTYVEDEQHLKGLGIWYEKHNAQLFTQGNGHTSVSGLIKFYRKVRNDNFYTQQRAIADAKRNAADSRTREQNAVSSQRGGKTEGQASGKQKEQGKNRTTKTGYADLFRRNEQPSKAIGGILNERYKPKLECYNRRN